MNFFCHNSELKQNFTHAYFTNQVIDEQLSKRLFFAAQINNYWYGIGFLKVANRDSALNLSTVNINDLSTPIDFWKLLSIGKEDLSTSLSQSRLGLCILKYAYSELNLELKIFS